MAEMKTQKNDASVEGFLNAVKDERRRADSFTLLQLMCEETGMEPVMWGPAIVGFGDYHYRYASGREGDMPLVGFSPRKQNLTLYLYTGLDDYGTLLERLGKHTTSKACLYIRRLDAVDLDVLRELVRRSVEELSAMN